MLTFSHYAGMNCTITIYECDECGEHVKIHLLDSLPTQCPYCGQSSTEVTSVPTANNDPAS